jgi:hypothetical protein
MRIRILRHGGKCRICLLGALVLTANTHAATATPKGNPYAKSIVGRNAFGLNAAPPPIIVDPLRLPPPHITLQGLTTILRRRQVLFKLQMPSKPGEPAREISCVLSEGERQGEIEVLEIDDHAGTVKFNNHGTEQTLSLKISGNQ